MFYLKFSFDQSAILKGLAFNLDLVLGLPKYRAAFGSSHMIIDYCRTVQRDHLATWYSSVLQIEQFEQNNYSVS